MSNEIDLDEVREAFSNCRRAHSTDTAREILQKLVGSDDIDSVAPEDRRRVISALCRGTAYPKKIEDLDHKAIMDRYNHRSK